MARVPIDPSESLFPLPASSSRIKGLKGKIPARFSTRSDRPSSSDPEAEARVQVWTERIRKSGKVYQEWERDFRCTELESFYYGFQHRRQGSEPTPEEQYTINLFYPTIESTIPSLLYQNPEVSIQARPPFDDDPVGQGGGAGVLGSLGGVPGIGPPPPSIEERMELLSDTATTLLADPEVDFHDAHLLALKESFFRFGVVYAGFESDPGITQSPQGKPGLPENEEQEGKTGGGVGGRGREAGSGGASGVPPSRPQPLPVKVGGGATTAGPGNDSQPPSPPTSPGERVFYRWIPARQFRVPATSVNALHLNDWCAYYEWVRLSDVRANSYYEKEARDLLVPAGRILDEESPRKQGPPSRGMMRGSALQEGSDPESDLVQLWFVWDIRRKVRFVISPSTPLPLTPDIPFKTLPFSVYKPHERLNSFYPLPPCFNWLHPQREMNESREAQRIHRRRFYRRYGYRDGAIDPEEIRKMQSGGDGVLVKINGAGPIAESVGPIPDAPLSIEFATAFPDTKQDFLEISGIGSEQRGLGTAKTATGVAAVQQNFQVRQSYSKEGCGRWVAKSVTILLQTLIERASFPVWVKLNVDAQGDPLGVIQEVVRIQGLWKQVKMADFQSLNWECKVNIESLSPDTSADRQAAWTQVMGLLTNPQLIVVLASSDLLLKRTLGFFGIRNQKEIAEVRKAMQVALVAAGLGQIIPILEQARAQGMGGAADPNAALMAALPQMMLAGALGGGVGAAAGPSPLGGGLGGGAGVPSAQGGFGAQSPRGPGAGRSQRLTAGGPASSTSRGKEAKAGRFGGMTGGGGR